MRNARLQQQQKHNNNILYALAAPVFDLPRHLSFPPFLSTAARLAIILNLGSHFAPCARLIIKKLRILIRYMCHINKQHTHTHTETCMCSCMCICLYLYVLPLNHMVARLLQHFDVASVLVKSVSGALWGSRLPGNFQRLCKYQQNQS